MKIRDCASTAGFQNDMVVAIRKLLLLNPERYQ